MACQGSAPPARPGLGPRDGGQWPSLLGMPRAAYLFPPCCPAQVRAHPRTSAQRGMSFLTGVPVPTPPLPETWQGCRWSGAGLLQHADLRRRPSCTVGPPAACLAHYPLHTSSWGGRFPSPSVRTKYLTRLASVPSRGGGRGKNRCLTVKRPLCTSLTPPPAPTPAPGRRCLPMVCPGLLLSFWIMNSSHSGQASSPLDLCLCCFFCLKYVSLLSPHLFQHCLNWDALSSRKRSCFPKAG